MLPLVQDGAARWKPGWCTYSDGFDANPDVEIFCGGENDKAATAAACWRQGNLLHFGFEQSPAELNETGQRLLLNCIAYISRFTEDRPTAVTPSVFAGPVALPRTYLDRRFAEGGQISEAEWMLDGATFKRVLSMQLDEARRWFAENRQFLHPSPGAEPKLEVDADARQLGIPIDRPEFFSKVAAVLDAKESARAKTLLDRYAPEAIRGMNRAEIERWFAENKDFLFFSDQGDYRWYIDPLAKKRGVPAKELRGPLRASKK